MKGRKLRKFVGIMSLMLLVMLTVPIQARAEDEEDDTLTSLDRKYEYRILDPDANTVEITAAVPGAITTEVIEDERVLFIPETIDDKYTVVSLGDNSFRAFKDIDRIQIPTTVTHVGEKCFYACSDTKIFDISTNLTSFGNSAFAYTQWLLDMRHSRTDRLVIVNKVLLDGRECTGDVVIPSGVKEIAGSAFYSGLTTNPKTDLYSGSTITGVTIPDSVTVIGDYAFCKNTLLKNVTFGKNVKSIGVQTFAGCEALQGVTLPESVESLGIGTFYLCKSMTSADLHEAKITSLPISCFHYCAKLTNVVLPDTLQSTQYNTFAECTALADISLPDSFTTIGKKSFNGCTSLKELTLPGSITAIGEEAFIGISDIKVTVPENVTDASEWSLTLGDGVSFSIKAGSALESFMKANSLNYSTYGGSSGNGSTTKPSTDTKNDTVTKPSTDTTKPSTDTTKPSTETTKPSSTNTSKTNIKVGKTFKSGRLWYTVTSSKTVRVKKAVKQNYAKITVPATVKYKGVTLKVTYIGAKAFAGCRKLQQVKIGNNVTTIGNYAFSGCVSLKTVDMGKQVKKIGRGAFKNNRKLVLLYIRSSNLSKVGIHALYGVKVKKVFLVTPKGKSAKYRKMILRAI